MIKRNLCLTLLLPIALIYSLFTLLASSYQPAVASFALPGTIPLSTTTQVFLPLVTSAPGPPLATVSVDFGSIITRSDVISFDFSLAKEMGAEWTRFELPWLRIEPTPGASDWSDYDRPMERARQLGVKVLAVIHSPPTWAAIESCGPVSDTIALTTFVNDAITRYGDVVDAWEFINEPDGKMPLPSYGPTIGCWASAPDTYAAQLALFYSRVRALDPSALVLFGSIAYDNWTIFDRQFLENALSNGAGAYFDVLGIHFYPINKVEFPSMRDKIQEVRTTLNNHGAGGKRIWVTETSAWTNAGESLESQKDFIVREQARGLCSGADNLFWFDVRQLGVNLPINRWLINLQHQPDQGYFTYQYFAKQIKGTSCRGRFASVPANVEAYHFAESSVPTRYIMWSTTTTTTVSFPGVASVTVTDRDGNDRRIVAAQNGVVAVPVGVKPLYVVLNQ